MNLQTHSENEQRKRAADDTTTQRRQDNFAADLRREYQIRRDGVMQSEQTTRKRVAILAQTLAPIWKTHQDTYTQQMHITDVTALDGAIVTADAYPIMGQRHNTNDPNSQYEKCPAYDRPRHTTIHDYRSGPEANPYVTLFMTIDGQFIATEVCACRPTYHTKLVRTHKYKATVIYDEVRESTIEHTAPHYGYVTLDNLPIAVVSSIEYHLYAGMDRMSKSSIRIVKRQLKRAAKH